MSLLADHALVYRVSAAQAADMARHAIDACGDVDVMHLPVDLAGGPMCQVTTSRAVMASSSSVTDSVTWRGLMPVDDVSRARRSPFSADADTVVFRVGRLHARALVDEALARGIGVGVVCQNDHVRPVFYYITLPRRHALSIYASTVACASRLDSKHTATFHGVA